MNNNMKKFNNSNNGTKDMGFILKVVVILLIAVICIIALAVIARNSLYYSKINNAVSPILIYQDQEASKALDSASMDNIYNDVRYLENHTKFSISMWIYIEDWDYAVDKYKIIYQRKVTGKDASPIFTPVIALDKYENNLIFGMSVYDSDAVNKAEPKFVTFTHSQIPLQKWVNIVYNISDQFVSLYLNGYMENKYYLDNIYYLKGDDEKYDYEILGNSRAVLKDATQSDGLPGFSGLISKMQYFAKNLNNEEIKKIYENGPFIK